MDFSAGERIKQARKDKGLTLNNLAARSGISYSFLSKIERGLNTPTIIVLQKICHALGISINDLTDGNQSTSPCVKKEDRRPIYENSDSLYEQVTPQNESLVGDVLTVFPNSKITTYEHVFDEVGLVLSGEMEFTLNDTEYHLSEGDTIYVRSGSSHIIRNNSDTENCVTYWVKAIPSK